MSAALADSLVREALELERLLDAARNGRWDEVAGGLREHDRRLRAAFEPGAAQDTPPTRLALERLLARNRELAELVREHRAHDAHALARLRTGRRASRSYDGVASA